MAPPNKKPKQPTYDSYFNQAIAVLRPQAFVTLELMRRWAAYQHGTLPSFSYRTVARNLDINFRTAKAAIQELIDHQFIIPFDYNPHFRSTLFKINFRLVPRMTR